MKKLICFLILMQVSLIVKSQENNPLSVILNSDITKLKVVIDSLNKFEAQVIYSRIDRNEDNVPSFTDYSFNVDETKYFYPASTVKLPACVLALEKLNELSIEELDKFTSLKIDSAFTAQSKVLKDATSQSGKPSLAHYIKKILLVSDNDAFNRLYEFIGQKPLNDKLYDKGLRNFKIVHRLSFGYTEEGNANTNPFTFYNDDQIYYEQPAQFGKYKFQSVLSKTLRGKGYINSDNKLINEPMQFEPKNFVSLPALHEILKRIIFPCSYNKDQQFNLTEEDYSFLYKYMSMLPGESDYPKYDSTYYDSYVKFLVFGDNKNEMPDHIRVFNKVGLAYGFITDFAFVVDFKNKIEFLVSATLHVNDNLIYNDGIYEYDEIGIPFLAELGRQLYKYELNRKREFTPDLSSYYKR
jgi:hypothetical protein